VLIRREAVAMRLTRHQAWRLQVLGEQLWPGEELGLGEISRRLLLEYALWLEAEGATGERGMVNVMADSGG
jgi:hypothetical protein